MLKLTVSPGEFLMIGEDIKIIFAGGDKNQIPIAIEAPRDRSIIRSSATKIIGFEGIDKQPKPYKEKPLSDEAKRKITAIVAAEHVKEKKKREAEVAKTQQIKRKAAQD